MVRTVAKVLLTCVPSSEDGDTYVEVIDAKDNAGNTTDNTGWIKMADVNYMLNVLNRKTYLDYRIDPDDKNYLIDPNHAMSEMISLREEEGGYGITNLDEYQRNYLFTIHKIW